MKKLVCLLMLCALGCPVLAVELDWAEFCPPMYLKIEAGKKYFWGDSNYWSNRRMDFENKRSNCMSSQNADTCLTDLRTQENNKNTMYYNQQQMIQNASTNGSIISAGVLAGRH